MQQQLTTFHLIVGVFAFVIGILFGVVTTWFLKKCNEEHTCETPEVDDETPTTPPTTVSQQFLDVLRRSFQNIEYTTRQPHQLMETFQRESSSVSLETVHTSYLNVLNQLKPSCNATKKVMICSQNYPQVKAFLDEVLAITCNGMSSIANLKTDGNLSEEDILAGVEQAFDRIGFPFKYAHRDIITLFANAAEFACEHKLNPDSDFMNVLLNTSCDQEEDQEDTDGEEYCSTVLADIEFMMSLFVE